MKKIAFVDNGVVNILDSKNYLKIEKDGQHIDDKYINSWGEKINSYGGFMKKGNLIMRRLYWIDYQSGNFFMFIRKFRHYELYDSDKAKKIDNHLNTKNSVFDYNFDFDHVKVLIVSIFSRRMKIE